MHGRVAVLSVCHALILEITDNQTLILGMNLLKMMIIGLSWCFFFSFLADFLRKRETLPAPCKVLAFVAMLPLCRNHMS